MPADVVVVHCARGDTRPSTQPANEANAESIFVVVVAAAAVVIIMRVAVVQS